MLKLLVRSFHQSYLVVALASGMIVGAILGLVLGINYFASPIWIVAVVLLFVLAYFKPQFWLMILIFIAGTVLMFFRIANELAGENYIRNFYGQTVVVKGTIEADAEIEESNTKFKIGNLAFGGEEIKTAGTLYVSVTRNEEIARGDTVVLSGKLSEGFGVYAGYMYRPVIKSWQRLEPGDLILKVRNSFAERVGSLILEPEVNLGLSYLLGMKAGLPDDLSENLRIVGLVHIVVASGAHLGILVGLVRKMFGNLSRMVELIFSTLFVMIFMAMIGWTPSILRAGIMTILTLITWYCGRKIAPWRLILIVAAVTLMMNPMFLINLGWLLSFASFGGIMIVGPRLTRFFYGNKKPNAVAEIIITTISATIMTLPIILYYYGTVSLISVVANLLILPTLPYAMGLVFLTGVVMGIPWVETVVAWCAKLILDFHITIVNFFGGMNELLVKISPYQWQVFLIYLVIFGLLLSTHIQTVKKMIKYRKVRY